MSKYFTLLEMKWEATKMVLVLPLIMLPMFALLVSGFMLSYYGVCDERFDGDKYEQCIDMIYDIWSTPLITLIIASVGVVGFFFGMKQLYRREMKKYE